MKQTLVVWLVDVTDQICCCLGRMKESKKRARKNLTKAVRGLLVHTRRKRED